VPKNGTKYWHTSFRASPGSLKGMVGLFRPKRIILVFLFVLACVSQKIFIKKLEKKLRKEGQVI
jgi:hypothetical protein